MEPSYYQPQNRLPSISLLYKITMLVIFVNCVWLVISIMAGYGHLNIAVPSGTSVMVNGHLVQGNHELKMRPGVYRVTIQSAPYYTTYKQIQVSTFRTTTYKPELVRRSATSVINASSPSLQGLAAQDSVWLHDNTWLVTITGRGGAAVVASHYTQDGWELAYGMDSTQDVSSFPSDVAASITKLTDKLNAYN